MGWRAVYVLHILKSKRHQILPSAPLSGWEPGFPTLPLEDSGFPRGSCLAPPRYPSSPLTSLPLLLSRDTCTSAEVPAGLPVTPLAPFEPGSTFQGHLGQMCLLPTPRHPSDLSRFTCRRPHCHRPWVLPEQPRALSPKSCTCWLLAPLETSASQGHPLSLLSIPLPSKPQCFLHALF